MTAAPPVGREARAIYLARSEALLRTAMPKALEGNVAAAEVCRKVIADQARVHGLFG